MASMVPGLIPNGQAGGDHNEELGFGLTVESAHWQILRVWSRIWLLTK